MDAKKVLEVVVLGGTLVVSANGAWAANACSNGTSATVASGGFIKVSFQPKCSANVDVTVLDSTSSFSVKSQSRKGKTIYGGSTEGGGIGVCSGVTASTTALSDPSTTGC